MHWSRIAKTCLGLLRRTTPISAIRRLLLSYRSMQPSASTHPSAMPDTSGAATPTASRWSDIRRPWVLVDGESRIGRGRNATTATALASNGAAIEVSFELADPPAVSLLFAHFPDQRNTAFGGLELQIVNAAGAFVLLSAGAKRAHKEYFVYRAGPGRPSLHLLPTPNLRGFHHDNMVGVLPLPDGQHYAVVIPVAEYYHQPPNEYRFNVFRSDYCHQQTPWSTKLARGVAEDEQMHVYPGNVCDGVVYAGAGLLGWIDLHQGVLLCNVLDEDPVVRSIRWPVPAATTFGRDPSVDGPAARLQRHATIADGVIRFTELEYHQHCRACRRSCGGAATSGSKGDMGEGWTITTWTKTVHSPGEDLPWHEVYTVDARDVSAAGSSYPRLRERMSRCRLLPDILDDEGRLAWEKKPMSAPASPTLSLGNHDVVYIIVTADSCSSVGWMVAINGREKTMVDLAQFNKERMFFLETTPLPCNFSDYLDTK